MLALKVRTPVRAFLTLPELSWMEKGCGAALIASLISMTEDFGAGLFAFFVALIFGAVVLLLYGA